MSQSGGSWEHERRTQVVQAPKYDDWLKTQPISPRSFFWPVFFGVVAAQFLFTAVLFTGLVLLSFT